jgi:hypothetical protein
MKRAYVSRSAKGDAGRAGARVEASVGRWWAPSEERERCEG